MMRSKQSALNDQDIRAALMLKLKEQYSQSADTMILEELGLRHGQARIDIALIGNSLQGIEIKSHRDTLDRLPDQVRVYNSVLDEVTLVVGAVHLAHARRMVPTWWGLQLAESTDAGTIKFVQVRKTRRNPLREILAVAELLWRDEALALLKELGAAEGYISKPRADIYERLVNIADSQWLFAKVCDQLRSRTTWRSDSPPKSYDD